MNAPQGERGDSIMSMKIDYDELRKKAEAADEIIKAGTIGIDNLKVFEVYQKATPPTVVLRRRMTQQGDLFAPKVSRSCRCA